MPETIQHIYKSSPLHGGLLYAWFSSMHTRVDIALCGRQDEEKLILAVSSVYELLCRLEKLANYYDATSELACLNRTAFLCPQKVSPELYDMLAFCLDSYTRTGGCFNVTVHSDPFTPDTIHSVELSLQEHTLFYSKPGVSVNLSGFLKGYALDKIRGLLTLYEIENALINMGNSSVLALGHHPLTEGWKVSFNQSAAGKGPEVLLLNECLTTSGNHSHERKHIINPQTGQLVEGKREIAVVTAGGATGEVLSTSLFVADACRRELLKHEFLPRQIFEFLDTSAPY